MEFVLWCIASALLLLVVLVIVLMSRKNQSGSADFLSQKESWTSQIHQLNIQLAKYEQQILHLESESARSSLHHRQELVNLHSELKEERQQLLIAERSLASAQKQFESQQQRLAEHKQEVEQLKRQLHAEFQVMANQILEDKTKKFTESNSLSMDRILSPLREKIKSFEEKVEKTYQHEAAERNTLKGVVEQLMEQSRQIKDEANSLSKALRGDNKKQGNWGEVILERVLERSGLTKDQEYRLQASLIDEDGRRFQPDAIIYLPDQKHLVVDSKVSLVAYERWVNAELDEDRESYAKQHILSIENHVKALSAKNYQELYQINSPDFVLLFMPIESAFSMSVSSKAELFSDAWDRRVVLVSPSTLLATLRTIASVWKQERQTRNVLDIAKEAGALYDKFAGFMEDMNKVGDQLDKAKLTHESARKKLETGPGNVLKRIDNLKKLGAKANKQLDVSLFDEDSASEPPLPSPKLD